MIGEDWNREKPGPRESSELGNTYEDLSMVLLRQHEYKQVAQAAAELLC